tara:strand:- start:45 stop:176 length:132 start_codon:yes stop_codon:yes gene_type:complete
MMFEIQIAAIDPGAVASLATIADVDRERARDLRLIAVVTRRCS